VGFVTTSKPSEARYDSNNWVGTRRLLNTNCISNYDLFYWDGNYVSEAIFKNPGDPATKSHTSGGYTYTIGQEKERWVSGCAGPIEPGNDVLTIRYEIVRTPN